VLYIDGEMPGVAIQERLAALVVANELEPPEGFFQIVTPDAQPCSLPDLATVEGQAAFQPLLGDSEVIIADNLSVLMRTGVENEGESWIPMATWALARRREGRAVVFVPTLVRADNSADPAGAKTCSMSWFASSTRATISPSKGRVSRWCLRSRGGSSGQMSRPSRRLLTVRGAVEKEESGYRKAQRQLVLLRREGEVPYNWIADNTRWMHKPTTYAGLGDFFDRAATYYRQDLWIRSDVYVEVWCEKDALAGVLMPVTREYDVPLMVARGYSSETFAYNAAEAMKETGKPCFVYYVGDFDPSGWQMARNLEQKLAEFGAPVVFERLTVNRDQIQAWDLPTRPSKVSDTLPRPKPRRANSGQDKDLALPGGVLSAVRSGQIG
jgi:hypothetical protein